MSAITRMRTMIRKDARTGGRDQLTLYMLISPILLGLILSLLMPVLEGAGPQFVVDDALAAADQAALVRHGEVEVVGDRAAVIERVRGRDDVTGVVADPASPGGFEVLVQGDEAPAIQGLARAILEHDHRVRAGEPVAKLEFVAVGAETAPIRLIATALLGYCVVVVVGLMLGFAILEEKSTQVAVALDVSPLRFAEYLGAKLALALGLSVVMTAPAFALALGLDLDWLGLLVTVIASVPFAISLGLVIGVVAKDQLGAIAVMKALLPIWASLPILGFVLPERWLWTQWIFANHWGAQGLYHVLGDGVGIWTYAALDLVTGIPVFLAAAWLLRRRIGMA